MKEKPNRFEAIVELVGGSISGTNDGTDIIYNEGQTPPTESAIDTKFASMISDWEAQEYARKRQAEYPSIQELVVALYDTDDKADIEAKRAEVKKKYPKP